MNKPEVKMGEAMNTTILYRAGVACLSVCLSIPLVTHGAEKYRLGIAPVLDYEDTLKNYQPLADYLSQKAGIDLELMPARNFIGYWNQMRKPDTYDFVFDGAHLAAYRSEKMDHRLLAKVSGVLSFTLISRPDDLILDPEELVNRKVAVLASPNLGGLLAHNLFHHPARQPAMVEVKNAMDALEAVRSERADAAYVPTPILQYYPEATVISSSRQLPNMTMTASSRVPVEVQQNVARALIEAGSSDEGKAMLAAAGIASFEPTQRAEYSGLETLLSGMWGY